MINTLLKNLSFGFLSSFVDISDMAADYSNNNMASTNLSNDQSCLNVNPWLPHIDRNSAPVVGLLS